MGKNHFHRKLVVSIPRLSAPFCHLLGKINAMGTFFSMRQLCLQSKCLIFMEITDVAYRKMFPQHLFFPSRWQDESLAVYTLMQVTNIDRKNNIPSSTYLHIRIHQHEHLLHYHTITYLHSLKANRCLIDNCGFRPIFILGLL